MMLSTSSSIAAQSACGPPIAACTASWIRALQSFGSAALSGSPNLGRELTNVRAKLCRRYCSPVSLDSSTARHVVLLAMVAAMESTESRSDATHLYLALKERLPAGDSKLSFALSGSLSRSLCPSTVAGTMRHHVTSGQWEYACTLLALLPRSQETISAGVQAFARAGWNEALRLLLQLEPSHWQPQHAAVVIDCLRSVARRHTMHWIHAMNVYSFAIATGVAISVRVLNNMLSVLGSSRRWHDAITVLKHSSDTSLLDRGNAVTITQTCFALHLSGWSHALLFASRIISRNANAALDSIALEKLSALCVHSRRWQEATAVLSMSLSLPSCALEEETYLQLVAVFHSRWRIKATLECLNKVQKPDLLHTALNTVIVKSTSSRDASGFAERLKRAGGTITTDALATLTELHAREDDWVHALWWFGQWASDPRRLQERVVRPYYHDCLQLSMEGAARPYGRGASWEISVRLFSFVCGELGVDVTPISRNSVQSLCYQHGKEDIALRLMQFAMMPTERRKRGSFHLIQ
jgi:hypothetical protein